MTDLSSFSEEIETVRLFNELLPWTFNCRTLIDAARHGRTTECEDLIRLGVDINESDHHGNTALWTSYFHEHLETLFTLLQLGADPNTRSGDILCSDLHRACSFGDRTLTEILIECGGHVNRFDRYGKTPLIYALESPSSNSTFDLISYLVERGADINHKDQHGFTPLHYACYRGDYQVVQLLIHHRADLSIENSIGYNILRYALTCLSYTSPSQSVQYANRLKIVDLVIEQYTMESNLSRAIIGKSSEQIHLYPLFDFLVYALIQQRDDLEEFTWYTFATLSFTEEMRTTLALILQNTFVHSHYYSHPIYICQRFRIENCLSLLAHYIEHVSFDAEPSRFRLLLYLIYVDQGLSVLQLITERFDTSLKWSRRCLLRSFLLKCQEKPARLKFYSRRLIRKELSVAIHTKLEKLNVNQQLKNYILINDVGFFFSSLSTFQRIN